MIDAPELLPCPFCGGSEIRLQQNGYTKLPDGSRKPTWWEVTCDDCDFVGPGDDREKVIAHWNRRAALSEHPAVQALVAEAEARGIRVKPPERVYRADWIGNHYCEGVNFWSGPSSEYILATPAALSEHPAVQALVAEAVAAERERCAAMVLPYIPKMFDVVIYHGTFTDGVTKFPVPFSDFGVGVEPEDAHALGVQMANKGNAWSGLSYIRNDEMRDTEIAVLTRAMEPLAAAIRKGETP